MPIPECRRGRPREDHRPDRPAVQRRVSEAQFLVEIGLMCAVAVLIAVRFIR